MQELQDFLDQKVSAMRPFTDLLSSPKLEDLTLKLLLIYSR